MLLRVVLHALRALKTFSPHAPHPRPPPSLFRTPPFLFRTHTAPPPHTHTFCPGRGRRCHRSGQRLLHDLLRDPCVPAHRAPLLAQQRPPPAGRKVQHPRRRQLRHVLHVLPGVHRVPADAGAQRNQVPQQDGQRRRSDGDGGAGAPAANDGAPVRRAYPPPPPHTHTTRAPRTNTCPRALCLHPPSLDSPIRQAPPPQYGAPPPQYGAPPPYNAPPPGYPPQSY